MPQPDGEGVVHSMASWGSHSKILMIIWWSYFVLWGTRHTLCMYRMWIKAYPKEKRCILL